MDVFKSYLDNEIEALQSSASVADSWVHTYIEGAPFDIDSQTPITFDPTQANIVGDDLTFDSGDHTKIHVATAGRYVLSLLFDVTVTSAGTVLALITVAGAGYWGNGSDVGAASVPAGGGQVTITFPPAKFDVGDVQILGHMPGGTLGGLTQVYLVRTA